MIDVLDVLADMAHALRTPDFPDADLTVAALHLDMSAARINAAKSGLLAIVGAKLKGGAEVDLASGIKPRRLLMLLLKNSCLPFREVAGVTFGDRQRIVRSKVGEGLAVRFDFDGLVGTLTASGPEGVVESLSCEAPRAQVAG